MLSDHTASFPGPLEALVSAGRRQVLKEMLASLALLALLLLSDAVYHVVTAKLAKGAMVVRHPFR
jgi:hypothetical protein